MRAACWGTPYAWVENPCHEAAAKTRRIIPSSQLSARRRIQTAELPAASKDRNSCVLASLALFQWGWVWRGVALLHRRGRRVLRGRGGASVEGETHVHTE